MSLVLATGIAVLRATALTAAAPAIPNDDRAITHALNRLAFGPASGDVEARREARTEPLDRPPAASRPHSPTRTLNGGWRDSRR